MKPPAVMLIDLETSGLWKERLPFDDPQQPWAVSIAMAILEPDGSMRRHFSTLIKPDGRTIHPEAEKIHGISTRKASQDGTPEARVLGLLSDHLKTMPMDSWFRVVSYGDFDPKTISSLFARFAISQGKPSNTYDRLWRHRPLVEFVNLMDPFCTQLCKIPSEQIEGSYKWPSLDESAEIILGREPRGQRHDAWQDMLILRDLYLNLRDRGMFKEGVAA